MRFNDDDDDDERLRYMMNDMDDASVMEITVIRSRRVLRLFRIASKQRRLSNVRGASECDNGFTRIYPTVGLDER